MAARGEPALGLPKSDGKTGWERHPNQNAAPKLGRHGPQVFLLHRLLEPGAAIHVATGARALPGVGAPGVHTQCH